MGVNAINPQQSNECSNPRIYPFFLFGHESEDSELWRIQGKGPGTLTPFIFRPNWGPKGRKNFF